MVPVLRMQVSRLSSGRMSIALQNLHEFLTAASGLDLVEVIDVAQTEKRWAEGRALTDPVMTLCYADYVGQLESLLSFLTTGVMPPGTSAAEARAYLPLIDRLTAKGMMPPDARLVLGALTSS
jgi:hypothetical protein